LHSRLRWHSGGEICATNCCLDLGFGGGFKVIHFAAGS
jgi:hypothetical protein